MTSREWSPVALPKSVKNSKPCARRWRPTKEDLADLRSELKADLAQLRGDVEIMIDKYTGVFRKDFDELAARVKRLQQLVLK
jgi:hypothetical protein